MITRDTELNRELDMQAVKSFTAEMFFVFMLISHQIVSEPQGFSSQSISVAPLKVSSGVHYGSLISICNKSIDNTNRAI